MPLAVLILYKNAKKKFIHLLVFSKQLDKLLRWMKIFAIGIQPFEGDVMYVYVCVCECSS